MDYRSGFAKRTSSWFSPTDSCALLPAQALFRTRLVPCPLYFQGCVGPSYSPLANSRAAIVHDIPESHQYNSLCESVAVPILKPDFLLAELYLVLVGADNEQDRWFHREVRAELSLDHCARRTVNFLCLRGWPRLLPFRTHRQ